MTNLTDIKARCEAATKLCKSCAAGTSGYEADECPLCIEGHPIISDLETCIAEVERLQPFAESQPALLAACEKHKKIVVEGHNGNTAAWDANYADMEAAIKAAEGE